MLVFKNLKSIAIIITLLGVFSFFIYQRHQINLLLADNDRLQADNASLVVSVQAQNQASDALKNKLDDLTQVNQTLFKQFVNAEKRRQTSLRRLQTLQGKLNHDAIQNPDRASDLLHASFDELLREFEKITFHSNPTH